LAKTQRELRTSLPFSWHEEDWIAFLSNGTHVLSLYSAFFQGQ
jgi:hypothetical protein